MFTCSHTRSSVFRHATRLECGVEILRTDRVAVIVALAVALGGCASVNQHACGQGEQFVVHENLSFGTAKANGSSRRKSGRSSCEEPSLLASHAASPHWKVRVSGALPTGQSFERRPTFSFLTIQTDAASENAVREIISTYKSRFQQEAVFRVKTDACISF